MASELELSKTENTPEADLIWDIKFEDHVWKFLSAMDESCQQ